MSILIKDTTPMERIQIVKDSLGGEYDEFYDDPKFRSLSC